MSTFTINYTNGALTGTAPDKDHISGLVFVTGQTLSNITGMTSGTDYSLIQLTSLSDAESKGVTSTLYPLFNYHVSDFFEQKPDGLLYLIVITNSASTFTEIPVAQKALEGEIRNFGVFESRDLSATLIGNLNTALTSIKTDKMPAVAVYGANTKTINYSGLTNLSTLPYSNVSVMVGEDSANGLGLSYSVPAIGMVLGAIAASPVQESAAYRRNHTYNVTTPALGNGGAISTLSASYIKTNLEDKNYLYFEKTIGDSSVYLNNTRTATSISDDYRSIQLNRTIQKSSRLINLYLAKELNAPIELNSKGWIAEARAAELENIAGKGLADMQGAGEISAYSVYINPDQNILSTSNLQVVAKIVPFGTSEAITVTLGFAATLA
jgi:hypothetical protein